jgi:hypothetical protein
MIKSFEEYTKYIERITPGSLQYISEFKKMDSKEGKNIVKKIIDVVKNSVKLKKKEEDYLDKHYNNEYLNKNKDKKLSNAWTLVITKEYMCTNPGVRYPIYYYVVDEKDSIEENKSKAFEIYDNFFRKNKNNLLYRIDVKNTEYDKDVRDESKNDAWQVISYEYELTCTCSPDALRYLIIKAKDSPYTKEHNIEVKPKKVDSKDEFLKVMDKIKKLYYDKQDEVEKFLNTPLDKIDDFEFKIKPSDADID